MNEEATGTPTEATEHVSIGENGVIQLSEQAMLAMEGTEPPAAAPAEEAKPAEPPAEAPAGRKIKHNGQEVEVKPEQEIELLQKGYDYEYRKAALEQERAKIQAYQGLVSAIESSPVIKQKVTEALGYGQPAPEKPAPPQFDDPIEQLKWETRQETIKEVEERFVKPFQQQQQMTAHQIQLAQVRQKVEADPQFKEVQAEIINQIKALPEVVGKNLYLQLDQDPNSYMAMFQSVKERLKPNINPQPGQQPTEPPPPTKRETKAPILESVTSPAPEAADIQKQREHIKALEKRSRAGDYRATGELMAMLS